MEAKFNKIRSQINSKLENQKLYASTLIAIEETIQSQNGKLCPVAYFGAIMTTLQATASDNAVTGALLYLLCDVLPDLPQPVLRSKFLDVVPILERVYAEHQNEQPIVRSIVSCLQELLVNQDANAWSMPTTKKAYHVLLVLSANASPKARKAAQDAVRKILSHPPPPTIVHPAAGMTAEAILRVLHETTAADQHAAQQILALLQTIIPYWPPYQFAALCQILLQLPKFNNIFLTKATFGVFEALFDAEETDIDEEKLASLLSMVCEMKPAAIDGRLLPAWLLMISKAFSVYARMNPARCGLEIAPVFCTIFNDLQLESPSYSQVANCLCTLVKNCITDDMIAQCSRGETNGLNKIIEAAEGGLSIHFQAAWSDVMRVHQALFQRLHHAAAPLMDGCVALLGELRLAPADAYKDQLDKTLGAAVAAMGPEHFLSILPLNLEPASSSDVGRAFLLPLLKVYTSNTNLGYFVNVLLPLADRLAERAKAAAEKELSMQAKIYETLVNQIWSLAPGFCTLPTDLRSAFTNEVAERFSTVLYSQPELRPTIAQALQLLVEKNRALSTSEKTDDDIRKEYRLTKQDAIENLQYLSNFSVNYLAVFFNVFSTIPPAYRGFLADVIKVYLSIASSEDINATFKRVLAMLNQALETPGGAASNGSSSETAPAPLSHTMLDLMIIMVPFLDLESSELLYNGAVQTLLGKEDEPALQKKGYKILKHLIDSSANGLQVVSASMEELQVKLLDATATCTISARKDRIKALLALVPHLPASDLHFIPAILSEVVICTKDNNEKTRSFAFSLLVEMGKRMKQGGVVQNSKLQGVDSGVPDANATISEYFTMVTAGLAGTTAHMIAATITALSRIFYEFREDLPSGLASELLQTINVFVPSNNREIARAALGYVKVCIVVLNNETLEPQVAEIVGNVLKCSHQTRNHFKPKIRHIFERLIRRFSYERVSELVPEDDKKLIANIQKRRMRAKRKKEQAAAATMDVDMEGNSTSSKKVASAGFHDAYEEVLYGSESELDSSEGEDDDEEMMVDNNNAKTALASKKTKKKQKQHTTTFIREDEDTPLDFLDKSALSRITSSKPKQRKKPSLAKSGQFDEDGRLIVVSEPSTKKNNKKEESSEEDNEEEEDYYMEAQKSEDGFIRTAQNKIKFKKTQKKQQKQNLKKGAQKLISRKRR